MSKSAWWLSVCLLLFASPALAQGPCEPDFPHDSNPTKITDEDVCNFHQVDRDVYRGGRPRPSAYPKLVELGIHTIINLEETKYAERERAIVEDLSKKLAPDLGIDFVSSPINELQTARTGVSDPQLKDLFQKIHDARKPIFIHCYHGKDRTGAIVALYRVWRGENSFQNAYDEALHYRFSQYDFGLKRTLHRYENPQKLHTLPAP